MATFYILYSAQLDKFYIGHTEAPIETRLYKHLADHSGFTGKAKDWIIAYSELFETKSEALRREKQAKSWKSKAMIMKLIGG